MNQYKSIELEEILKAAWAKRKTGVILLLLATFGSVLIYTQIQPLIKVILPVGARWENSHQPTEHLSEIYQEFISDFNAMKHFDQALLKQIKASPTISAMKRSLYPDFQDQETLLPYILKKMSPFISRQGLEAIRQQLPFFFTLNQRSSSGPDQYEWIIGIDLQQKSEAEQAINEVTTALQEAIKFFNQHRIIRYQEALRQFDQESSDMLHSRTNNAEYEQLISKLNQLADELSKLSGRNRKEWLVTTSGELLPFRITMSASDPNESFIAEQKYLVEKKIAEVSSYIKEADTLKLTEKEKASLIHSTSTLQNIRQEKIVLDHNTTKNQIRLSSEQKKNISDYSQIQKMKRTLPELKLAELDSERIRMVSDFISNRKSFLYYLLAGIFLTFSLYLFFVARHLFRESKGT
ncbi:MAG: hypothetical protein H6618_02795 [Deltaproteobacteria bacterium]|nr:hypothetical protein [Deltaproteobacteria bacterium]